LRQRLGLELSDVVAERRAGVVAGRHQRRLVLAHLDEDGRGRGDGDEDEPARDGRRVLGPLRRRARGAGADGALRHVHHRLHARARVSVHKTQSIALSAASKED
jgi:hypothetical protein